MPEASRSSLGPASGTSWGIVAGPAFGASGMKMETFGATSRAIRAFEPRPLNDAVVSMGAGCTLGAKIDLYGLGGRGKGILSDETGPGGGVRENRGVASTEVEAAFFRCT